LTDGDSVAKNPAIVSFIFQTSEKEILVREQGEGASRKNQASDVVIYKIEVPANR